MLSRMWRAQVPLEIGGPGRPTWTPIALMDHPHGLLVPMVITPLVPASSERFLTLEERAFVAALPSRRRLYWTAGRMCLAFGLESLGLLSNETDGVRRT